MHSYMGLFQLNNLFNINVQLVSYWGLWIAFLAPVESNSAVIVDFPELVVLELDFVSSPDLISHCSSPSQTLASCSLKLSFSGWYTFLYRQPLHWFFLEDTSSLQPFGCLPTTGKVAFKVWLLLIAACRLPSSLTTSAPLWVMAFSCDLSIMLSSPGISVGPLQRRIRC